MHLKFELYSWDLLGFGVVVTSGILGRDTLRLPLQKSESLQQSTACWFLANFEDWQDKGRLEGLASSSVTHL